MPDRTPEEIVALALNDMRKGREKWVRMLKNSSLSREEISNGLIGVFMSMVLHEASYTNLEADDLHNMFDRLIIAIADGLKERTTLQ